MNGRQGQVERPKRIGSLSSETPSYLSTTTSEEFGEAGYGGDSDGFAFDPESFARNRASEVAQGRLAMLASVGCIAPELLARTGIDLTAFNALGELQTLGAILACQVLVVGALEASRGILGGDSWSFDPLGLASNPDDSVTLTVKEIKNGRLALVSVLGFTAQGVVTGKGPIQNLIDHLTDPFSNNLLSYATSSASGIAAFEPLLTRTSFATLFLTTLLHWGKPLYMKSSLPKTISKLAMGIAYASLTGILLSRWASSGHLPLSNLYESSMFLSWCFCTIHLVLENQTKTDWIGIITAPSALLTNAFATLGIPKEMQQSTALVPALQSNWLMMHVSMMIFSYSTLMIGSLLAIAFLFVDTKGGETPQRSKLGEQLDHFSYRSITLGFPLLTIGILSGAVWANEAWGSYWSWDPKETWALITWLVFAIYVHTRMNKGWQGKKPAMVASGGFFVIWICYLGVNLLGKGLHSYGWFSS